jgi:hypothetical protein
MNWFRAVVIISFVLLSWKDASDSRTCWSCIGYKVGCGVAAEFRAHMAIALRMRAVYWPNSLVKHNVSGRLIHTSFLGPSLSLHQTTRSRTISDDRKISGVLDPSDRSGTIANTSRLSLGLDDMSTLNLLLGVRLINDLIR